MRKNKYTLTLILIAACGDGTSPSLLDHATLLAAKADPPRIGPGERAKIAVLATDDAGTPVELDRPAIKPAGLPEELAAQMVEENEEGSFLIAPPAPVLAAMREQAGLPADAPIPLTLELDVPVSSIVRGATKIVLLGGRAENPRFLELLADGEVIEGDRLELVAGTEPRLSARAESAAGEVAYAWYSSAAELEDYRAAEATLLAAAPVRGKLAIVVRDDAGGTDWRILDVEVR